MSRRVSLPHRWIFYAFETRAQLLNRREPPPKLPSAATLNAGLISGREILESHNPAILERDRLHRIADGCRKRIVKRIPKRVVIGGVKSVAMAMTNESNPPGKAPPAVPPGPLIGTISRSGRGVDPGLRGIPMHHSGGLLLRLTPRHKNCLLRHAAADLTLAHERLLVGRELAKSSLIRLDSRGNRAAA